MIDFRLVSDPIDLKRLSEDHWREFHDHTPDFKLEYLQKARCIQAFDNDTAIGYLFLYVFDEPHEKGIQAMVDLYYLDPKYRGRKIAKRMFGLAESLAKLSGARRITASYNLKKPHPEFFKAMGFTETHVAVAKEI